MAKKKKKTSKLVGTIIGRFFAILGGILLAVFIGLYTMMWIFCHGPSTAAKEMFATTMLETGALKFLVGWYLNDEEVNEIVDRNKMVHTDAEVDPDQVVIKPTHDNNSDTPEENSEYAYEKDLVFDDNGIAITEVSGRAFYGKMMIVKNPKQVVLSTIYPWSDDKSGITLDQLVYNRGAVAGINGGEYESDNNWGGRPKGLVVCNGEIQYNNVHEGDVLVGFNNQDILVIKDIGGMGYDQVASTVSELGIRDAVSFKDEAGVDSNHFTKLIINGEPIQITGNGSGANPRTVIGQRKDGVVLLFVTDGRGASGHIGATAADVIEVMQQFGAYNAANIDGGSSSSMYYNDHFEMTSVTMYFSNSSWKLPDGFVVMGKEE